MFSFLSDLLDNTPSTYTVVVLDEGNMGHPRQYTVRPRRMRYTLVALLFTVALAVALIFAFTPITEAIPGNDLNTLREEALLTADAVARLQDSLDVQRGYIEQLQHLLLGDQAPGAASATGNGTLTAVEAVEMSEEPPSEDWEDHTQPALPIERMTTGLTLPVSEEVVTRGYLSSLLLPVLPPVDGLVTRGFDPRGSHYAVDIAAAEGTSVRAIGDGYVIFADWTNDGGNTLVIQHADGYVSVYKHNKTLRKRVGDQVRDREAIAISGNTGEITTGPHLHFELWHEGLAQDPQQYFLP